MSNEQGLDLKPSSYIWGHLFSNLPTSKVDLTGRTVLVTGGNTGLGYQAVLHFARCNASRIVIASRSLSRCTAAAEQVYKDVTTYRGVVDVLQVDLSSFANVISFAEAVNADQGRLDVVILNAGIAKEYEQTADGYESVLQVNGLSTALMGLLLLPKLEKTAGMEEPAGSKGMKPTMTVVAGETHYWTKFPHQHAPGPLIEALNDPAQFIDGQDRAYTSKLLSMFNPRELAKLPAVASGRVIVNCVNPGLCTTGIRADLPQPFKWFLNSIGWTAEKGARNYVYAATQNTKPGAYVSYCKEMPPSSFLFSDKGRDSQERYWKESLAIFRGLEVDEGLSWALGA